MRVVLCLTLVLSTLSIAAPAAAQVCSTTVAGVSASTTCDDGSSAITTCAGVSCTTDTFTGPSPQSIAPIYLPPPVVYVPPADSGIRFSSKDGYGIDYWPQGQLVKSADGLAIYIVWSGQLHAFQTWESFLRSGGKADLSNVLLYGQFAPGVRALIGTPVPL